MWYGAKDRKARGGDGTKMALGSECVHGLDTSGCPCKLSRLIPVKLIRDLEQTTLKKNIRRKEHKDSDLPRIEFKIKFQTMQSNAA
jgi:hypothetical protein